MLRIILGKDWVANRDRTLSCIVEDVSHGKENIVLLVPELISHDMERRLCAAVGDRASACAQVLSFSRLVSRVSEERMLAPGKCLDNGGRLVAMAAAVRQLVSKLKAYAGVETRPEFLAGLVDAVDEFKRCCITPADIALAASQSQGAFAQKLEELSLILETYDSICAQGKRDPRDQMNWVLEQLECCDYARNHEFYIDGFPDLTRQNTNILEHLIRFSPQVTVSLNCDSIHTREPAFETAAKTAGQLVRLAKAAQVPVRIITEPSRQSDALARMTGGLFQGAIQPDAALQQVLQARRCDSIHDECAMAAEQVLELVADGCRYRDIAIVCGDMEGYRGALRMAFRRCGIPLYLSGTDDILNKTAIHTVLLALETVLDGFEQTTVLRYLRSSLSGLDMELCDRLENYAVIWGIRGSQWLNDFTLHPGGLGKEFQPRDTQLLEQLNQARRQALTPLAQLRDELRRAADMKEQVSALYTFLERIGYAKRLEKLAAEADGRGDNPAAQELLQLWEILVGALEQLYDLLGDTVWEGESFLRLLRLLLSRYDVGTIPPVLDSVTAGPVSAMRCQQSRHLLVLGASEGSFPSYTGSAGILSDRSGWNCAVWAFPLPAAIWRASARSWQKFMAYSAAPGSLCGSPAPVSRVPLLCAACAAWLIWRSLMAGTADPVPPWQTRGRPALTWPALGWNRRQVSWGWRKATGRPGRVPSTAWVPSTRSVSAACTATV